MRSVIIALTGAIILAGCSGGDGAQTPAEAPADERIAQFINWGSLPSDQIIVTQDVNYTVSDGAARISGVAQYAPAGGSTGGVGVRLPDDFERAASGTQVRVTVRASSVDPGALLGVAYSTADVGNSGWQAFNLTSEPQDFTFDYAVPALQAGNGDFLGFRSYDDDAVIVYGYQVELIGAPATP